MMMFKTKKNSTVLSAGSISRGLVRISTLVLPYRITELQYMHELYKQNDRDINI